MGILEVVLIIILVLLLVGALPGWSHSGSWGYWPSGLVFLLLVLLIIFLL